MTLLFAVNTVINCINVLLEYTCVNNLTNNGDNVKMGRERPFFFSRVRLLLKLSSLTHHIISNDSI